MSQSNWVKLYLLNRRCWQFFTKDANGCLQEWTDPFLEESQMIDWFSKWCEYWEARGIELILIIHDRHPKKLET